MPLHSMTTFASQTGQQGPFSWVWDLRSVNGRGLDLRVRVPDWVPGLEQALRKTLTTTLARGSVQVGLRITRDAGDGAARLDPAGLEAALAHLGAIAVAAQEQGQSLAPVTAADVAQMPGVLTKAEAQGGEAELAKALIAQLPDLMEALTTMRATEGAALQEVIAGQLDQIEALVAEAAQILPKRSDERRVAFARALDRLRVDVEPERLMQEMAILAVKTDVAEEIDRLTGHIAAAREILDGDGPHGRKLDFLSQEFNREANTLCSKSQDADLTRVGLDLKLVIDQMREQIQNVE